MGIFKKLTDAENNVTVKMALNNSSELLTDDEIKLLPNIVAKAHFNSQVVGCLFTLGAVAGFGMVKILSDYRSKGVIECDVSNSKMIPFLKKRKR